MRAPRHPHSGRLSTTCETTPPETVRWWASSAANRFRSTFVPVRLAFTWLGNRKTLAPEQRDTAARAFHADRELLSATWWDDMGPSGGPVLGPFGTRGEAIEAETGWLSERSKALRRSLLVSRWHSVVPPHLFVAVLHEPTHDFRMHVDELRNVRIG